MSRYDDTSEKGTDPGRDYDPATAEYIKRAAERAGVRV